MNVVRQDPSAGIVSFFSSNERTGHWTLPRRIRVLAIMGHVQLDLRDAEIGIGVSIIEAVAVLGNIEIIVPPHVAVECDGDALVGPFTLKYEGAANTSRADAERVVRITGTAYAASVEVQVKPHDEPLLDRLGRHYRALKGERPR